MKRFSLYQLVLILMFSFVCFFVSARAQNAPPEAPREQNDRRGGRRPSILRELGLSPEQLQQIRRLNDDRKPLIMEAQNRVRDAMRNLDAAIYADSINDGEIESRLKELQTAQAEIARIKARNEIEVRKILTPEQLVKFRELRRRFADKRKDFQEQRRNSSADEKPSRFNRRNNRRAN